MKLRHSALVVVFLLVTAPPASASERESKPWVAFPVTTRLQHRLIFASNSDAYVQIDVESCLHNGKFDVARLGSESFAKDLTELARQSRKTKPQLQLCFRYAGASLDRKETRSMEKSVSDICRKAGFPRVRTMMTGEGGMWTEKMAMLETLADDADTSESPLESDVARVYPVRTRLSRFLLGNQTDCFIVLRQPIDGRFQDFSPEVRRELAESVAKLGVGHRRRVTFNCDATTAGEQVLRRFTQNDGRSSPAAPFVKELGFQTSGWGWTPMGVKPEKLLGKPAPDFTLEALEGGPIHLREMMRGRVGIIAFWGVGCGACCEEARYLSELSSRHANQGLVVIGINGYNESRPVVEKFVREGTQAFHRPPRSQSRAGPVHRLVVSRDVLRRPHGCDCRLPPGLRRRRRKVAGQDRRTPVGGARKGNRQEVSRHLEFRDLFLRS